MNEAFPIRPIFDCLVETAALRRDASSFYRLHTAVPHLARSVLTKHAEARYYARFFDSIRVSCNPIACRYETFRNEHVHGDGDVPAVFYDNGKQEWWKCGKLHRDDHPAVIKGTHMEWWIDGKRHRDGQPALISDMKIEWWLNDKLHREDGPAIAGYNVRKWYEHGRLLICLRGAC